MTCYLNAMDLVIPVHPHSLQAVTEQLLNLCVMTLYLCDFSSIEVGKPLQ